MFAPQAENTIAPQVQVGSITVPDYTISPSGFLDHILAFFIGLVIGFGVLFVFYQLIILSVIGGAAFGVVNIFFAASKSTVKRKERLRTQFFDLLEAMSVAMRSGSPPLKALQSAKEDLSLIYPADSDIIVETSIIIGRFNNAIPLSVIFDDFAKRSGIEDIASFASVYATIEGKSSRADEIIRETQQIISDKMEIEMEIDTLMTAAKSEVNAMLVMPLIILAVIGFAGSGFMEVLYQPGVGRIVATGGFIVLIISFILARIFSNIKL